MKNIKPLPTSYAGVKFKSRAEARWAVFFDRLGVRWLYETEGYETSRGWYLPDFYLPKCDLLLEIKRSGFIDIRDDAEEKLRSASMQMGVRGAFLISGTPIEQLPILGDPDASPGMLLVEHDGTDVGYRWCDCSICGSVGITFEGRIERLPCGCETEKHRRADSPKIKSAMLAARGFNFLAS